MRIGSFLWFVAFALVALGGLGTDWIRLRDVLAQRDQQIANLQQLTRQAQKERQDALNTLHASSQNLQACQQQLEESNRAIALLKEENTSLQEQNRLLVEQLSSNASRINGEPSIPGVQAASFGLVVFFLLGSGSIAALVVKQLRKYRLTVIPAAKRSSQVSLTDIEIKELIRRRRAANRTNPPSS
jgi:hypothetical protein